ncbi:MAG: class I adenylate-forming enzyme family protein [Bacilli bacterium]|nr:class I adenylate-forming enzyme family protein [Bacilli bacterium]MDD3098987.1 class I adenylate-forming enzyme family protein [Bacilli bacterium]
MKKNSQSRIAIIAKNSIKYIELIIDEWNKGNCIVLLDYNIPYSTIQTMLDEANVNICYVENGLFINKNNFKKIKYIYFDVQSKNVELVNSYIYDKYKKNYSKQEALIIYSSGTTGTSKGIILTHYAITTNADSIQNYMKLSKKDIMYIMKPLFHSSTIVGELLVCLKNKVKIAIGGNILIPRKIIENINKFKSTVICVNPYLLGEIINYNNEKRELNVTLKTIYISGSILPDKIRLMAKSVLKNINLCNMYGLTEAGPRVSAQTIKNNINNSVGKAIKKVKISVVDESGKKCKKNTKGVIYVKTKSVFQSYVKGNVKHMSLYKNWLNTGDIGYFDNKKNLYIIGRIDDVIIYNSHKIYPLDLEKCILNNLHIEECYVTSYLINENILIVCFYKSMCDDDLSYEIKKCLSAIFLPYEIPKFYIKVKEIIRNSNKKINKKNMYELFKEKYNG